MKLTFFGGVETVTGSKTLLSLSHNQNFLVDCGLFQGHRETRKQNWRALPFSPKNINAVVLTHAHIDHTGYTPLFVKKGFHGPIYCTYGTKDLCEILLPDSAHLQEAEAQYENRLNDSKNKINPLYNQKDVLNALKQFSPQKYNSTFQISQNTTCEFMPAGHIIGAAFVKIIHQNKSILFTGDIGRMHDDLMHPPSIVKSIDYLVLESTYGDRVHEKEHPKILLKKIINQTIARGGTIVIPAFAVGRSQIILHYLAELKNRNEIPNVPIFLDSPLAIQATEILLNHTDDHNLTREECKDLETIAKLTSTTEESKELDKNLTPKIIVSASGMATGGRVIHHLKTYLPHAKNTILFTGFQTPSTRGARLLAGTKEIEFFGEKIPVNAEIFELKSASAHADSEEILEWLKNFHTRPKKVFLNHGDKESANALKEKIHSKFGWNCIVPHYNQSEILS